MRRLFISFSAGQTSALMAFLLLTRWRDLWDEIIILFANTGKEREESLIFAKKCAAWFESLSGIRVVWVERIADGNVRLGTAHKVVSFETASRKGEPFEGVIAKYGIPNTEWLHCTRELKTKPMVSYLRSIGWKNLTYDTAIGIRADEAERRDPKHVAKRIIYPVMDRLPITKPHVNEFFRNKMPFRLELTGYQGNCDDCHKKSLRKLFTLMAENPSSFDWWDSMEKKYGHVGAEIGKPETAYTHRVFFRGNLSTQALRDLFEKNRDSLEMAEDDSITLPNGELFPLDLEPGGCAESCEVNFTDAELEEEAA